MIYDDFSRQVLLAATGGIFACFALWAALKPKSLAASLGYALTSKNAISEFHAIYVGVFIAQAGLCALAWTRVADATLGNLVAVFLLGQPFGRMIAAFRGGWPAGFLLVLFIMEVVGGSILLLVQPSP
ncbi:MAG: DUF4345 family protein [Cyanobacteria bacterium P01_F01_bin.150]